LTFTKLNLGERLHLPPFLHELINSLHGLGSFGALESLLRQLNQVHIFLWEASLLCGFEGDGK
jgi:hypothetical protein